jgi:membrane protease YdiL (CAAX protease family)
MNVNGLIAGGGVVGLLLLTGAGVALVQRGGVSARWLLVSAGLVLLNDALLTGGYGLLPTLFPAAAYNWQGKLLALGATLAVASMPAYGWPDAGLTFRLAPEGRGWAAVVSLVYAGLFIGLALVLPNDAVSREGVAFQLTMPGIEEETFYRGVLLLTLFRAFPGRTRLIGVEWSWGALVSSALFGLAHAFGFSAGRFSVDPLTMLLTGGPSLLAVWLALRTRSVLLPILLHNFGNAIVVLL